MHAENIPKSDRVTNKHACSRLDLHLRETPDMQDLKTKTGGNDREKSFKGGGEGGNMLQQDPKAGCLVLGLTY